MAVMAVEDANTPPEAPPATEVTVADSTPDSTAAPATTEAPTTTLAKGFENYKAGDALPAAPAAPVGDAPVQTVPGPNGPIYPDGYSDPNIPKPSPTAPPITPTTQPKS